jgi:hypothetical protein
MSTDRSFPSRPASFEFGQARLSVPFTLPQAALQRVFPLPSSWQTNPGGQQNSPHTWPVGQQMPLMHVVPEGQHWSPQTADGGQQMPFIQVVPGGQHDETPPLPAIALHSCPVGQHTPAKQVVPGGQQLRIGVAASPPMQTCALGQQTSSRHCIPGGQQNGGTPAAALPPQRELGRQQAPLAQTVPGGQQMPPSQACPAGQHPPLTHCVPVGQQTAPPLVIHTWLSEQQRPQTHTWPDWQHVPPQKFVELGVQPVETHSQRLGSHVVPGGHWVCWQNEGLQAALAEVWRAKTAAPATVPAITPSTRRRGIGLASTRVRSSNHRLMRLTAFPVRRPAAPA